ncbi:MAG: hypothetical protein DHS20C11_12320 [Lysobacteraceae bacterium]|nr:MAG: hypothetical protein DHS20C11_12320 [Xanthomonadaceae bacterium]
MKGAKTGTTALLLVAVAIIWYLEQRQATSNDPAPASSVSSAEIITTAYQQRQSDVQVTGTGVVERIFADDTVGSQHQKFLLRLHNGHTLLISHNIDLAPRINQLAVGDIVDFNGEYEWNPQGGVVHWTHHDPAGRHEDGWLRHQGAYYQ